MCEIDLLHLLCRVSVMFVWMMCARLLAVCILDLLLGSCLRNTQYLVQVFLRRHLVRRAYHGQRKEGLNSRRDGWSDYV